MKVSRILKQLLWSVTQIIAKCDKYCKVRLNLLQSVPKCEKKLLQSVACVTKCESYYKVSLKFFSCHK